MIARSPVRAAARADVRSRKREDVRANMYRLYDYLPSGNGYKVRLVLKQLHIPYEFVEVDIKQGASRTPEFLARNPNGRIPVLQLPDGIHLPESHAIISYLAEGSALIPADRLQRARMWQWMCFEQYNLEPNVGTVRFWVSSLHKTRAELGEKLVEKKKSGYAALDVLEEGLRGREFLVGGAYSLADIALFAYTHVAHEGGFDLAPYPAIRAWCERVVSQPDWAPITQP
jgi:glutathione S-transferase